MMQMIIPEIFVITGTLFVALLGFIYRKNIKVSFFYAIDAILLAFCIDRNASFWLFGYSDYELIIKITMLASALLFYKMFCKLEDGNKLISVLVTLLLLCLSISASDFVSLIASMDFIIVLYVIFLHQDHSIGRTGVAFAIASAVLMIISAIIIYALLGTTSFNDIQYVLSFSHSQNRWIYTAVMCLLASFCIKIGAFPLHYLMLECDSCSFPDLWLLFCISRCSAILIFHKIMTTVFHNVDVSLTMTSLGLVAIVFSSVFLAIQTNFRKIFVYLASFNSGISIIASVGNGYHSRAAIIFLIMNEIFAFTGLFGAMNILKSKDRNMDEISDLNGLRRWSLPLSISILFLFLSILGVPPFLGTLSKFHLCMFLLQKNFILCSAAVIISVIISLVCATRISTAMWINQSENNMSSSRLESVSVCCIIVAVTFLSIPIVNKIISLMMMEA